MPDDYSHYVCMYVCFKLVLKEEECVFCLIADVLDVFLGNGAGCCVSMRPISLTNQHLVLILF